MPMPKQKRRTRQRCRWWDEVSELCGAPHMTQRTENGICHWSIRCQGPRKDCGWEEKGRRAEAPDGAGAAKPGRRME